MRAAFDAQAGRLPWKSALRVGACLSDPHRLVALGALRRQVLGMIVRQAMVLTGTGAVVGLAVAAVGAQLLTEFLYGIPALDPLSFLTAALLLGAIALVASMIPAQRAASVNPMDTLRAE